MDRIGAFLAAFFAAVHEAAFITDAAVVDGLDAAETSKPSGYVPGWVKGFRHDWFVPFCCSCAVGVVFCT